MILCHHQSVSWWGLRQFKSKSVKQPSRLMSCTQLVTSRPPRRFGTIPVDNFFTFMIHALPDLRVKPKVTRSPHLPETSVVKRWRPEGEIAEWAEKIDLLVRTVTDMTLRVLKWNPYIWRMSAPGVEFGMEGFNNLLKIHKINLCWRY